MTMSSDTLAGTKPTESESGFCKCRFCGTQLRHTFVDLGMSPLCQTHISPEQLNHMERFYPLHAYVCHGCFLVQLDEYVAPGDIFTEYAYFSSYADSWVEHARRYARRAIDALACFPASKAKSALTEAVEFAVSRAY